MRGNSPVRFLEGGAAVTLLPYSTKLGAAGALKLQVEIFRTRRGARYFWGRLVVALEERARRLLVERSAGLLPGRAWALLLGGAEVFLFGV